MEPKPNFTPDPTDYNAPMYKTGAHAGVLSTTGDYLFILISNLITNLAPTGLSTNFVVAIRLPSHKSQDYWVSMSNALLCLLSK